MIYEKRGGIEELCYFFWLDFILIGVYYYLWFVFYLYLDNDNRNNWGCFEIMKVIKSRLGWTSIAQFCLVRIFPSNNGVRFISRGSIRHYET